MNRHTKQGKYDQELAKAMVENKYLPGVIKFEGPMVMATQALATYLNEQEDNSVKFRAQVFGNAWYDRAIRKSVSWDAEYKGNAWNRLMYHTVKFVKA